MGIAMNILLSLSPFIAFFVLMRVVHPLAGLVGAFIVSLLLGVLQWRRGESVKVLEIGSLALFGALVFYTLVAAPEWTVATVRLAVDAGLFAIALVSLLVGRPFTLQYARESVPKEFWSSPLFLSTNRQITAAWTAAFAVMVCRRHSVVDRHCGDGRCLRRSVLVHALVFGEGAPSCRIIRQSGRRVMSRRRRPRRPRSPHSPARNAPAPPGHARSRCPR
jgi:hypothetical protein